MQFALYGSHLDIDYNMTNLKIGMVNSSTDFDKNTDYVIELILSYFYIL